MASEAMNRDSWSGAHRDAFFWVEFCLVLAAVLLAQYLRGLGHAYAYTAVLFLCAVAFQMRTGALGSYNARWTDNINGIPKQVGDDVFSPVIASWLFTLAAGAAVQAAGGFLVFERLLIKLFGKNKMLLPTALACVGVCSAGAVGTDAVIILYIAPVTNACKAIGLRPSKALSALIVSGIIGAVCSPLNPALSSIYLRQTAAFSNEVIPYSSACWINLPSAAVGAIVAGIVATFLGRDLKTSQTYKRRCLAGFVSPYNAPQQSLMIPDGKLVHGAAKEISFGGYGDAVEQRPRSAAQGTKLQTEYSITSRLSEGDYVYTHAKARDGSFVDINEREADAIKPKSVQIEVDNAPRGLEEAEYAAGGFMVPTGTVYRSGDLYWPSMPVKSSRAWTSVGLYVLACVFACTWGVLKSCHKSYTDKEMTAATWMPETVALSYWSPPLEYVYGLSVMVAAFLIMVVDGGRGYRLQRSSVLKFGLIGFAGALAYSYLGTSWMFDWPEKMANVVNYTTNDSTLKDSKAWVRIFWVLLGSAFTNNAYVVQRYISQLATSPAMDMSKWIAASIPMGAGNVLLPVNANMIAASEIDDTGSTRIGVFLFDHAFIIPGICGVAAAFGIAYGMAVALL